MINISVWKDEEFDNLVHNGSVKLVCAPCKWMRVYEQEGRYYVVSFKNVNYSWYFTGARRACNLQHAKLIVKYAMLDREYHVRHGWTVTWKQIKPYERACNWYAQQA